MHGKVWLCLHKVSRLHETSTISSIPHHVPHTPSYSYKIHSNTSRSGFESGAHSVVRRYSDFTWLSQELSKEFPGVIVPPLPEKLTVGRFGEEFVDSRRRGLEKFLLRIASHTELSNSQYFIVFLQAAESGLAEAKNESKNSSKAKTGTTIGWLEGTVNNLTTGAKVSERFMPHSAATLFLIMTTHNFRSTWRSPPQTLRQKRSPNMLPS